MTDIECQCRLAEVAARDRDARGLTAQREAPVGADHETRGQRASARGVDGGRQVIRRHGLGLVVEAREIGKRGGAFLERRNQGAVLDIIAEGFQPDFLAGKLDLGGADQAAGIVDEPHGFERGRLVGAALPDIQALEEVDGRP